MPGHCKTASKTLYAIVWVLAVSSSPVVGQVVARGQSILTLLPYENRRLELGARVTGVLSDTDYRSSDDRYVQAWAFEGRSGQSVTFDLTSQDFDAYLFVIAPGIPDVMEDDDGGGGCHSRVGFTLQGGGVVRVVVSSQSVRSTGQFTLSAAVSPEPANAGQCGSFNDLPTFRMLPVAGVVSVGDEVNGTLTSSDRVVDTGSHVQAWELRGDANQTVTVDLISDDFDAMLYLMGPGLSGALSNDDGGGGCHARITTILPESGTYRIIASSLSSEGTGAFTLRVSAEAGAVSEQECGRSDDAEFQPLADLPIDDRILQLGVELQGELTTDDVRYRDGSFVQAWGLEVVRGGSYTIDLRSEDFDSFLFVLGSGIAEILTDDDSGGGCHSRVTFQPSASGMIRVVASSIGAGRTGAFRLRVADEEGPVDSAPCQAREV